MCPAQGRGESGAGWRVSRVWAFVSAAKEAADPPPFLFRGLSHSMRSGSLGTCRVSVLRLEITPRCVPSAIPTETKHQAHVDALCRCRGKVREHGRWSGRPLLGRRRRQRRWRCVRAHDGLRQGYEHRRGRWVRASTAPVGGIDRVALLVAELCSRLSSGHCSLRCWCHGQTAGGGRPGQPCAGCGPSS